MIQINKNILSNDLSPYLKQHKDNPVHWQRWTKECLEYAKQNKKPILSEHWLCQLSLVSCYGSRKF